MTSLYTIVKLYSVFDLRTEKVGCSKPGLTTNQGVNVDVCHGS